MKLIAGLGNPGDKYEFTRHNAGFIVVSKLAEKFNITGKFDKKFNAIIGRGLIGNEDVLIVQPMTFMNLSGDAIIPLMNYYKMTHHDLLVVFDDISLDLGVLRFRAKGSDGGHNGIKSIIRNLGGKNDFARLKVGIGLQPPFMPSESYVLQKFDKSEESLLSEVASCAVDAIELYISRGIEFAGSRFNGHIKS